MQNRRHVIVYIAMSLDGYIAGPDDDLSFLSAVQVEGEDYGYAEFYETTGTVIMGRKTYDWVMTQVPVFPHHDKETYIITRKTLPSSGNIRFFNGSIPGLIRMLKAKRGRDIFVDGGAKVVNSLLKEDLIDEFQNSLPVAVLNSGDFKFHG
ncbi:MAG: dihydrofolate reductase [Bacteroidales bacterium]|nr:dihydrofolate reductase [Bacteroidales bacterium]